MEKPVDHSFGSSATEVAGSTVSGAAKGVGALLLGGLAVIGGAAALVAFAVNAPLAAAAVVGVGALAAVTAPVWLPVAGLGAAFGAAKGVSKVRGEQKAFDVAAHNIEQNTGVALQEAGQQAYLAGVHDGQMNVVKKLQEVQAAQMAQAQHGQHSNQEKMTVSHSVDENHGKWADRFKKDEKAISPEAIAKQREAAVNAQHNVG